MKRARERRRGLYVTAFVCLASAAAFVWGTAAIAGQVDEQQALTLERAIERAVVTCYALEGQYPPTLDYIREYYGVVIDQERYDVFYDVFAQNVMPSVTVAQRGDTP